MLIGIMKIFLSLVLKFCIIVYLLIQSLFLLQNAYSETQIFEYSLDYLESFWNSYKSENKMFLLQSLEGHEPTNQVIGHLDDILYKLNLKNIGMKKLYLFYF